MRYTKPAWVIHNDNVAKSDQSKRLSIFSVHVHPDGSRIATGGLDAKIRIWSTRPMLNTASEHSNRPPKSLCTLTMHTGPVLTVRWAHSGKWLASGSDDEIVMVWDLDPSARGKVWGSDEVNVEGWKPLKRLPGHESDVTDVAWAPEDRYLASVGLDSKVLIWCGYTLERLRKLDLHQGFVKGVCWDPVGEFLATQSDDRSVKIWRTSDWGLEAEVTKPFEDSPGSTFFRRLSWSPDGAHITASNATNNKGFVFIAAVIARGTWTSEISLVGHENTVEVAAYNPHIFLRNPTAPVATSNICSVVALGADDGSVSVWQTKSARPLIVARDVFERNIMDLSWSFDGLTLYSVSSDGTLAIFDFDPEELEGIAPHSVQSSYLQKFGFVPEPLPEGYSHHMPTTAGGRITPPPSPNRMDSQTLGKQASSQGFGQVINADGERVNVLVAKRKPNKKTQMLNAIPSAGTPSATPRQVSNHFPPHSAREIPRDKIPLPVRVNGTQSATRTPPEQHDRFISSSSSGFGRSHFNGDVDMDFGGDMDVPIDSFDTSGSIAKGKKKAGDFDSDSRPAKPRTLGGDRPRASIPVKQLTSGIASSSHMWNAQESMALPQPPLLTVIMVDVEGSKEDQLEGRNPEDDGPIELIFSTGKTTQWLDYLPSRILSLVATSTFCGVAMQDGSINVYSHTGRRIMPTLSLSSPCSEMDASRNALMVLTCSGQLYSWNIKKQSSNFAPTSVLPLIGSSPNSTIISANVRPNGTPVIHCSSGVVHSYDPALLAWVKISERWWSEGSDVWQTRQRANTQGATRGILVSIESAIGTSADEAAAEKHRPKWWGTAMTLGHLETKLHSTRLLDSPLEYKQILLVYAKKLADEGFRAKAEELIKELFGPVYWRPGKEDSCSWSPMVMGLSKRDLLKDVLLIFVRSKTLTKLALDWQDTMKKALADD